MKNIVLLTALLSLLILGCNTTEDISSNSTNTSTSNDPNVSESDTNTTESEWNTYENEELGFSFSYPRDWEVEENAGYKPEELVLNIVSPETKELVKQKKSLSTSDISIYYYSSISEEPENKSLGATTIEEFVEKNPMIELVGKTTLGNIEATDVIWGGFGAYYTILATKESNLYKIWFSNVEKKENLSDTEKQIISNFKFL